MSFLSSSLATITMVFFLSLGCLGSAEAFWNIWQNRDVKEKPQKPTAALKKLRKSTCGRKNAITVFGENAFMRHEADRRMLLNNSSKLIAAAYLAETGERARSLLLPLMQSKDKFTQSAARISLAFILFRRNRFHGPHISEILRLLTEPAAPQLEADRYYLRAVLALSKGDWSTVSAEAREALKSEHKYYNAHVLNSLAILERLGKQGVTADRCEEAIISIEKALLPILDLGACPTHVAHFDLAAERYLTPLKGTAGKRLRLIRRTYLAYVARNDLFAHKNIKLYRQIFGRDACFRRLNALDFS